MLFTHSSLLLLLHLQLNTMVGGAKDGIEPLQGGDLPIFEPKEHDVGAHGRAI